MKNIRFRILLLIIALSTACSENTHTEEELLQADREFSTLSAEQGMNRAFLEYCAEEGVILREASMPVEGREAIRQLLESRPDTAFILTWEPLFSRMAASGDLGYTYGTFNMREKATGLVNQGTYVSIWVLENGRWKWVLDTGNQGLGKELTSSS